MIELLFKMMFEDILLSLMEFVPDHLKRKEMYNEAVRNDTWALRYVPDHLKTQEMCDQAVCIYTLSLVYVPDHLKTHDMCDKTVEEGRWSLEYVPDWFVTQQQIKLWRDHDDYCNDDRVIKWYKGYQKQKSQKAQIKKELIPIAWHPSRHWDWCMSEDEKKDTEKLLA